MRLLAVKIRLYLRGLAEDTVRIFDNINAHNSKLLVQFFEEWHISLNSWESLQDFFVGHITALATDFGQLACTCSHFISRKTHGKRRHLLFWRSRRLLSGCFFGRCCCGHGSFWPLISSRPFSSRGRSLSRMLPLMISWLP